MKHIYLRILPFALIGSALSIPHAQAETLEELDAMAEVTQQEESGIQFAQQQAKRGEFLEAIATIERVLANHPKSQIARLLHAVYHCRIDDRAGGNVELEKLKKKNFPEETWNQAITICSAPAPESNAAPDAAPNTTPEGE